MDIQEITAPKTLLAESALEGCTINTRSDRTSTKCELCSENHTANYKGCMVYKALQIQKYPTLRKKEIPVTETTHQTTQHSTTNNVVKA